MNNKNKKFATNAYILNVSEVYRGCNLPGKKYLYNKPGPIYACNSEALPTTFSTLNNCPIPNNITNRNTPSESVDIVKNNINTGGIICDFKPRTDINEGICSRNLTDFVRPPCDYVQDIETEFYLIHGENSSCSSKYWRNRHNKNN